MFIGCGTLLCGKPYCVTFEYGEEKTLKLTSVVDYINVYWLWYIAPCISDVLRNLFALHCGFMA